VDENCWTNERCFASLWTAQGADCFPFSSSCQPFFLTTLLPCCTAHHHWSFAIRTTTMTATRSLGGHIDVYFSWVAMNGWAGRAGRAAWRQGCSDGRLAAHHLRTQWMDICDGLFQQPQQQQQQALLAATALNAPRLNWSALSGDPRERLFSLVTQFINRLFLSQLSPINAST